MDKIFKIANTDLFEINMNFTVGSLLAPRNRMYSLVNFAFSIDTGHIVVPRLWEKLPAYPINCLMDIGDMELKAFISNYVRSL